MLAFPRAPVNSLAQDVATVDVAWWRNSALEPQRVFNEPYMLIRLCFRQGEIVLVISVLSRAIFVKWTVEFPSGLSGKSSHIGPVG